MKPVEILLVDDSETDRLLTVEALADAHLANSLHIVVDGQEAMDFLRRKGKYHAAPRPDLILLDLNLPRKDGREVLAEIKADPELHLIPVVVLTTSKAELDIVKAYGLHANCYIQKPLKFDRFAEVVREIQSFWFDIVTLPPASPNAGVAVEPAPANVPSLPERTASESGNLRVLLVEDSPTDALLIREFVESAGLQVTIDVATRLAEATGALSTTQYDAVLLDLGLPDSQGLDTVRGILRRCNNIPTIVLTGVNDETVGVDAMREGAQDYVPKSELTPSLLKRTFRYAVERSRAEQRLRQAQRLETVGQLAGGVAHDFNNLLTVISAHASFLKLETPVCPVAESAQQIEEAAKRASNLVRQLLTFSRRQLMHVRPLNLNEAVGNIVKMLRRLLGENYRLELQLAAALPLIQADVGMIEQVIVNLAVNSRDAMPSGGKITLETAIENVTAGELWRRKDARQGGFVRLSVHDMGSGIPVEVLPHIFEPFYTTKAPGKGTGLGLSTVHGIAKQHDAWVEVDSKVGAGTKFSLYFPASKHVDQPSSDARSNEAPAKGTETILLVEDEASVREVATMMLQGYGYKVVAVTSGAGALSVWSEVEADVDVLLTDMVMPDGISGAELAKRLKALKPSLKLILTSGYSAELLEGGNGDRADVTFLQKPYTPQALLGTVRAVLDGLPLPKRTSPKP